MYLSTFSAPKANQPFPAGNWWRFYFGFPKRDFGAQPAG
jgi:hypothetical protein